MYLYIKSGKKKGENLRYPITQTNWVCLDCELMPWSAKAQELLKLQYAAVGSAGRAALAPVVTALAAASNRLSNEARTELTDVQARFTSMSDHLHRFTAAYQQYCWPVESLDDFKLAPFHFLATEGQVHTHQNHIWHMETLAAISQHDPVLLRTTPYRTICLTDPASEQHGISWWEELTGQGGEGMVVKPLEFAVQGAKGLIQPAVKCRGREYLRIIYGPDYTADENLSRLRVRGLGAKRSLALKEFALGIEALERFVRREPLRRIHECVFGVLALESEPVDPRL